MFTYNAEKAYYQELLIGSNEENHEMQNYFDAINTKIVFLVKDGFMPLNKIIPEVFEGASGKWASDEIHSVAEKFFEKAIEDQREEEKSWPEVTDVDRIEASFEFLEKNGIFVFHNLIGFIESEISNIKYKMKKSIENGSNVKGFVCFTREDLDEILHNKSFMLHYGSIEDDDENRMEIGKEISDTLNRYGITNILDTDSNHIKLSISEWKKRRFTSCPNVPMMQ